jgi:hypothetical protein
MLHSISRTQLAGGWLAAVVVLFAGSVVAWGAQLTVSAGALWVLACLAPPAVMLLVWRAPAVTVAELLYDVNKSTKDGQA